MDGSSPGGSDGGVTLGTGCLHGMCWVSHTHTERERWTGG